MRNLLIAIAFGAATLAPAAAYAADASVVYADLDLSTPAGKAELDARIDSAAKTVCTVDSMTGTRIRHQPDRDCVDQARSEIRAQLNTRLARAAAKGELATRVR